MIKWKRFVPLAALAVILAGCEPTIDIANKTTFGIRVLIDSSAGGDSVSPTPGNSSNVDAGEGFYAATAFLDDKWIAWAKQTRKVLNDRLADADHLTGPQLMDVVQRLKQIAGQMKAWETVGGSEGALKPYMSEMVQCEGRIPKDGDGAVITVTAKGQQLAVTCRTR